MPSGADGPVIENYRPSPAIDDGSSGKRWTDSRRDVGLRGATSAPASLARRSPLAASEARTFPTRSLQDERLASIMALSFPTYSDASQAVRQTGHPPQRPGDRRPLSRSCAAPLHRPRPARGGQPQSVRRDAPGSRLRRGRDPARYAQSPHRLPLALPGIPLFVEVHDDPNWPSWLSAPADEGADRRGNTVGARRRGAEDARAACTMRSSWLCTPGRTDRWLAWAISWTSR